MTPKLLQISTFLYIGAYLDFAQFEKHGLHHQIEKTKGYIRYYPHPANRNKLSGENSTEHVIWERHGTLNPNLDTTTSANQ